MALKGIAVQSKPRDERYPLEEISPDVVEAVNEVLAACQADPTVAVKYTAEELKTVELDGETFLKMARDYGYQAEPRLTVEGNVSKGGDVRIKVRVYVKP